MNKGWGGSTGGRRRGACTTLGGRRPVAALLAAFEDGCESRLLLFLLFSLLSLFACFALGVVPLLGGLAAAVLFLLLSTASTHTQ